MNDDQASTSGDLSRVFALMVSTWPRQDLSIHSMDAWSVHFRPIPSDLLVEAVIRLGVSEEWMPGPAKVLAAVDEIRARNRRQADRDAYDRGLPEPAGDPDVNLESVRALRAKIAADRDDRRGIA